MKTNYSSFRLKKQWLNTANYAMKLTNIAKNTAINEFTGRTETSKCSRSAIMGEWQMLEFFLMTHGYF
jgi:hypothetical protein